MAVAEEPHFGRADDELSPVALPSAADQCVDGIGGTTDDARQPGRGGLIQY
jgi:hypothetical protein